MTIVRSNNARRRGLESAKFRGAFPINREFYDRACPAPCCCRAFIRTGWIGLHNA